MSDLKSFEIREGNGNVGCYRRGVVEAETAGKALIKAHRMGMICSPWDVRVTKDIEGDDVQAYLTSYVGNGPLGARWCAESHDVEEINKRISESLGLKHMTDMELAS
jgi:hypothetical protein